MHISNLLFAGSDEPLEFTPTQVRKGGKTRQIAVPSLALYELQQRLLRYLYTLPIELPSATCAPNSSAFKNVLTHKDSAYFYLLDFRNAFPSVIAERLAIVLTSIDPALGGVEEVEEFLERYCMAPTGGLAQGGPASPQLFNLYCEVEVDSKIRALFTERDIWVEPNILYTRYVDDLTISSTEKAIPKTLRRKVRAIVEAAGFQIHDRKTQLLKRGVDAVEITGLRLSPHGVITLSEALQYSFEAKLDAWLMSPGTGGLASVEGIATHYYSVRKYMQRNRTVRRLDRKAGEVFAYLNARRQRVEREPVRLVPLAWLDELRVRMPLGEYIGRHVELKWRRSKREAMGLCPFHAGKSPSFSVAQSKGFFHCFGCGMHGDVIAFAMRVPKQQSFLHAVKYLAEQCNLPLPKDFPALRLK